MENVFSIRRKKIYQTLNTDEHNQSIKKAYGLLFLSFLVRPFCIYYFDKPDVLIEIEYGESDKKERKTLSFFALMCVCVCASSNSIGTCGTAVFIQIVYDKFRMENICSVFLVLYFFWEKKLCVAQRVL